jgi:signal transduction histidine kinase/CheY-like chemotaxis protein
MILMLAALVGVLGFRQAPLSIVVVGGAFIVSALTDTAYTYLVVLHDDVDGKWVSIGWQIEAVLLCIAAAAAMRRERGKIVRGARERGLALVLAGGAAAVGIVALDALRGELSKPSLALGVFAVVAVLLRLYTTSREKDRLATRLESALAEKQALVHELRERNDALSEHSALLTQSLALREQVERERSELEEQLRHSQKLEAVGKLAGGIAHDFNNLLTAMGGYASLLEERLQGEDRADAKEIRLAAERASALTHQLLAFGRKQVLRPQRLDLNRLVLELQPLLRPLLRDDVRLELLLADAPCVVDVDEAQLQQALVSLAMNARDAMPDGGALTVSVGAADLFSDSARSGLALPGGRYARLAVTDTGVGIDEDTRAHLFEPFFTTKSDAGGLGLATVHGIVRQSGGDVRAESRPGAGACFEIFLPLAPSEPLLAVAPEPAAGRTALLVDDESLVRGFLRRVLERMGWTVLEAENGDDALAVAAGRQVELLLTDVVMPGISGRELAERLQRTQPGLRAVFMSGHTDDVLLRRGVSGGTIEFLHKPFGERELTQLLAG